MSLDGVFKRAFGDDEPTHAGSGWTTGVLAVALGVFAAGGVLCLHVPDLLTTPDLRGRYPLPLVRGLIQALIGFAFLCGLLSALSRRRKVLGVTGMALALAASLAGGASVEIAGPVSSRLALGLDWFLLNLLLLAVIFVPLERWRPHREAQLVFRPLWTTDSVHFFVSHLLVQVTTWLSLAPATILFVWAARPEIQGAVKGQPLVLQVIEIVLVADLTQYAVHRAFHVVPALWRFHSVHHSSTTMDWLAGSRLHLVDTVVTRGLTFLPLFLLGFDERALGAYLVFVSFHAVFLHANVRFRLGALEPFLVTPRYHPLHHASAPEARDRNFAVHLPVLDRLFGTRHLPPEAWPSEYGLGDGRPFPDSWLGQTIAPFRSRSKVSDASSAPKP